MSHAIHGVASFEIVGPHSIAVTFKDGLTRTIDFLPVLRGELFSPLRDPKYFALVKLDPEAQTLTWPNGADFDAATLHDWPDIVDNFAALAQSWTEPRSRD